MTPQQRSISASIRSSNRRRLSEPDLTYIDADGKERRLNANLIIQNKVSAENIEKIKKIHFKLSETQAKFWNSSLDLQGIKELVKQVEDLEFELQSAWGFPKDPNYHIHWLRSPDCRCPALDNLDPVYFGRGKIISSYCEIHEWMRSDG